MTTQAKLHSRGGLYIEDFEARAFIERKPSGTVPQMDNMLFSNMTLTSQPRHSEAHVCGTLTAWGRRLVNAPFTLGSMIGISVRDTTLSPTIANPGFTEVRFPAPHFAGDSGRRTTLVPSEREFGSRQAFMKRRYREV